MKQNLSSLDRIVRLLPALVVAILYFTDQISGTAVLVLGAVGIILAFTSAAGFCPIYAMLKLSTKKST